MSINIARFQEGYEPKDEYRHMKQPVEIKQANQLEMMTVQEKEMYLEKLKTEINEHKFRESTY
jgi:hypothetical protein